MRRRVCLLMAFSGVAAQGLVAQPGVLIAGRITDAVTGVPLPYVSVRVAGRTQGTSADVEGFYELRLPRGSYTLLFTSVGYRQQSVEVRGDSADSVRCDVRLVAVTLLLDEVVVQGRMAPIVSLPSVGGVMLSPTDLKHVGGEFGDLFRSLQNIVGVTSNDETSSRLNVRGGTAGENLILLNGTQMFEPYHLKDAPNSSLTIFNTSLLKRVLVLPGGFPARYGNRLSAVVDMEYRDGKSQNLGASVDASLTDAGLTLEGPLGGRMTGLVNARTTFAHAMSRYLLQGEQRRPSFYDTQGILSWSPSETEKGGLFFLHSRDRTAGLSEGNYGADCVSLSGTSVIGPGSQMDGTLSWYRRVDDLTRTAAIGGTLNWSAMNGTMSVGEATGRLTFQEGERSTILAGFDVQRHSYDVRQILAYATFGGDSLVSGTVGTRFAIVGAYAEDAVSLGSRILLNVGARWDFSGLTRESLISPRLIFNYRLDSLSTLTASYGWFTQFATEDELLGAALGGEPPQHAQKATHCVLGYSRVIRQDLSFRVEGYWKEVRDLIPYRRLQGGELIYSSHNAGRARSYGVDLEASFSDQQVMGWINFGILVAKEQIDPEKSWHYRPTDQRRTIATVFEYRGIERVTLNLRAYYGSGYAYADNSPGEFDYARNHYPEYKRVDVRASYHIPITAVSTQLFVEVLNIFAHRNVLSFTGNGQNPAYPDSYLLLGRVLNAGVHVEL